MRLQINPPIAEVFPNRRQKFVAVSTPAPSYWQAVSDSGDIKSDFSLEVDGAGSQTAGTGAHWLFSGIGVIEFTIDNQCLPTGSGSFQIQGRIFDVSGFQYLYTLTIAATTVKVFDETPTEIYTETYSTVAGDIYRLELIGGFRFYRKSAADADHVLKHQRISLATQVEYPMTYRCGIVETTVSTPTRIPQPRLIGAWRIGPIVEWVAPSHGAISYLGLDDTTDYYGGFTPGTYTLTARIESAADAGGVQVANATIVVPPLQILGPTEITLEPGQVVRFQTNYPDDLIAWTVATGGGSFSQGEYTAAATPGTSLLRATCDINDQVGNVTVIVPAVITNPSNYVAAKPSEQIDFATNIATSTMPSLFSGGAVASGTGNVTPGMPLGVQENDVLLLYVQTANQTVSAPAGWGATADSPQGIGTPGAGGAVRLDCLWRRWGPGLVAPTVTDPGDHAVAQILAVRGCPSTGNPWDVTAGDAVTTSTSVSIPGDTTTVNDCLVVLAVANATDTATSQTSGYTNAGLTSLTERTDVNAVDGVGGGFAVVTGGKAPAGSFGATTATLATSSAQARHTLALKPETITWTVANSVGTINGGTGLFTAPSLAGQTARITVSNGYFTATIEIPILEVFPISRFATPMDGIRSKKVLISEADDGTDSARVKNKDGKARDSYPLQIKSLTLAEYDSIKAFWDEHHPGKAFILEDVPRQIRLVVKFDSDLAWRTLGGRFEVTFRVREVAAF